MNIYLLWDAIREFPRRVKWFIQRGRRGWADCDVWNFDTYLARVIGEGAAKLRDISHGHPGELNEFEWSEILSQIAHGFRMYATGRIYKADGNPQTIELFTKWFRHLWD